MKAQYLNAFPHSNDQIINAKPSVSLTESKTRITFETNFSNNITPHIAAGT